VPTKILLLTFYYEPDLCAGSFRAKALIEAFKEKLSEDIFIDIITTIPNRYSTFKVNAKTFEQHDSISIYRIPLSSHKSGLFDQVRAFLNYFIKAILISRKHKYNLVIATSSRLFTAFLGAIIARQQKAPLYLDIRDIFTDTMKEVLTNRFARAGILPLLNQIEKFTMNSSNHINLVSEGFRNHFLQRYNKSYSYFTNGIDPEFLDFDFTQTKKNVKPVITYAGNIGEGQGLHDIIPAAAEILKDEFEFLVIGDGGAKEKLKSEIKRLSLKNVKLIAPVNRGILLNYYKESDYLFLHLNSFKAFEKVLPSKIFEYGAANKPIIAGVDGYASEFLRENIPGSLIFKPGDVKSFIYKIRNFQPIQVDNFHFNKEFSRSLIMRRMVSKLMTTFFPHGSAKESVT
jgi:glycosyltransferase involved in cell wall biosynthesis